MQIKLLVALLLVVTLSGNVLRHFERDIAAIKTHYSSGETSKVYSILMKMLVQTKTLYDEMEIIHPHVPAPSSGNCSALMEEIVGLLIKPHWAEIFQEIYPKLHGIHQKCTNADFLQLKNENGFDDTCALCTVLSRVMENYVSYHRKDVAKFVEEEFCTFFDGLIKPTCEAFVHYAGPRIIKGLLNKENSDQICHSSNMCKNPECRVLGKPETE